MNITENKKEGANLFKSYTEIEQSREKYIAECLEYNPELEFEEFSIQEKLDGSNVQFIFNTTGSLYVASRKHILKTDEDFYGIFAFLYNSPFLDKIFSLFKDQAYKSKSVTILYGELFGGKARGSGINPLAKNPLQARYSSEKQIRFFDISIDYNYMTPMYLKDYFKKLNAEEFLVPELAVVKGLQNALNFDINIPTTITPIEGNLIEGIVIKPYNKVYYNKYNRIIYIKKKNVMFSERKTNKVKRVIPDNIKNYQNIFQEYVTQTRVNTIISKFGEITNKKDIGKYIQYVLQDAKKDFIKDYPEVEKELSKSEFKMILKCKSNVANWILDTI